MPFGFPVCTVHVHRFADLIARPWLMEWEERAGENEKRRRKGMI